MLIVNPKGKGLQLPPNFSLRLLTAISPDVFPAEKLKASKNNLRSASRSTSGIPGESKEIFAATPGKTPPTKKAYRPPMGGKNNNWIWEKADPKAKQAAEEAAASKNASFKEDGYASLLPTPHYNASILEVTCAASQ